MFRNLPLLSQVKEESDDEDLDEVEDDDKAQLADDPRAGGVHSVIPQLVVNYSRLADKMFELGSEDGLKKSVREHLYQLSKMFKDVASDVFPLGPNLEDLDEDIEIEEAILAALLQEEEEDIEDSSASALAASADAAAADDKQMDDLGLEEEKKFVAHFKLLDIILGLSINV